MRFVTTSPLRMAAHLRLDLAIVCLETGYRHAEFEFERSLAEEWKNPLVSGTMFPTTHRQITERDAPFALRCVTTCNMKVDTAIFPHHTQNFDPIHQVGRRKAVLSFLSKACWIQLCLSFNFLLCTLYSFELDKS
jgi:hypothetical protein